SAGEEKVLPALSMPVVIAAKVGKTRPEDESMVRKMSQNLRKELLKSFKNDEECTDLQKPEKGEVNFGVDRLTDNKLLVSTQCWSAAYNL
ncbi:DUF1176 domain-containing protein, partial [Acinetobacter baumannii]